jgi:hypothetical protein
MLREEHMLRMFQNRVLRKIFEPKREEVTGERGILGMSHTACCE